MAHAHDPEVVSMALDIADTAARSDIELHCNRSEDAAGLRWYDLSTAPFDVLPFVEQAAHYLQHRGRLVRNPATALQVRFTERA